ncbi:MAG TPA: ADP-ribosylglycohydrolase family protein [Tepidisphaeraceae bacterium]|nr:ADP-ribosylglycohydrolase family protein [Tepidisphaeraceae bacterium]
MYDGADGHVTDMISLTEKYRGCLLGAAVGDVAGAPVEAESPGYIARTYGSVDEILAAGAVAEFSGPEWQVGRFTDDTQMTLCVAEWLIAGEAALPERLLARFADAYEPWRRYGPATEAILRLYPRFPEKWRDLATASFPHGSYGNGSAMRVGPIGLVFHDDVERAAGVATESSRTTHSHPLAIQGAALQAVMVATAVTQGTFAAGKYLERARERLARFAELLWDTTPFDRALNEIERGLAAGAPRAAMADVLGTDVTAHGSVPFALYCFMRHPDSYADVIRAAVFAGGDTDTIACMAGAISGAFLGREAIPQEWVEAIREERYSASEIERVADRLRGTGSR